tara:strand:+ start:585 stop:755 length:171 start_codon:yes stop_codon:yes gene_type:complete
MKLINTNSPSFPSQSGSNTILLPDNPNLDQLVPADWDLGSGMVILVDDDTHETDLA